MKFTSKTIANHLLLSIIFSICAQNAHNCIPNIGPRSNPLPFSRSCPSCIQEGRVAVFYWFPMKQGLGQANDCPNSATNETQKNTFRTTHILSNSILFFGPEILLFYHLVISLAHPRLLQLTHQRFSIHLGSYRIPYTSKMLIVLQSMDDYYITVHMILDDT